MKLPFDQIRVACAVAAHEMNRIYCIALGDTSQMLWEVSPDWQRKSALEGVDGVFAGAGPEQSHVAWCAAKVMDGWKYGPVKDADKKEHPCLVSYADLPPEQREKDYLFVATVRQMASSLGYVLPAGTPVVPA